MLKSVVFIDLKIYVNFLSNVINVYIKKYIIKKYQKN